MAARNVVIDGTCCRKFKIWAYIIDRSSVNLLSVAINALVLTLYCDRAIAAPPLSCYRINGD